MKITKFSDYALRILIFLDTQSTEKLTTIAELADMYNISIHHTRMVVHKLGKLGYIDCIQGKGGGIRLACDSREITVGEVIRNTENDFHIVECMNPETKYDCSISKACILKGVLLYKALEAFLSTLDEYTIADLTVNKKSILKQLNLSKGTDVLHDRRIN